MYVLGIDGGGTQTTGIVADESGNVYMRCVTGRSNPNTLTQEEFESVFNSMLRLLKTQNPLIFNQLSICYAGIAGVGESGKDKEVNAILQRNLPRHTKVIVNNDAMNALYAGTLGREGIVQIAGTGAITLGVNKSGETARSGGWGYLFDDEGSGFYLGNQALKRVFEAYDNRGPSTTLTLRILSYMDVDCVPALITKIYGEEHPRSVIAPLARYVIEEAQAGDIVAKKIVDKACEKMMHSIEACHNRLFNKYHETKIVLSGGVFKHAEMFIERFSHLAQDSIPLGVFVQTQVPPVGGAVLAALAEGNIQMNPDFIKKFNAQIVDDVLIDDHNSGGEIRERSN
ncbi:hypothetical protein H9649_09300 [Sporosarcina sp. Sa2YVA2]|uniref:ATPase BadF/BadG/BcrA/BcrD type domain-containing protein n=1 Tax=Sporosarcina quadrami TaxID=2762234 RepID=A0ABR8U9T2_9BACL|nr:BadF/BadG/BcrA/BcrD ATPase family protein [Sporosarcina quadrami]MBD7984777.1 hypothetical protein [Sporosarcina quadrami]